MRTFAGIATLPGRPLEQAVRSLRDQVDVIGVVLNSLGGRPSELTPAVRKLVDVVIGGDGTNRGSSSKLHWASVVVDDVLYFACDDDLEYPPDYVARLRAEWERWGPRVIVTACGRTLRPNATRWDHWTGPGRYIEAVPEGRWINYLGGCAFAFQPLSVQPPPVDPPNEEEAVLSAWAQHHAVPIRLVARPHDWPRRIPLPAGAFTLYADAVRDRFATRNRIIATVPRWTVHQPTPAEVT